MAYCIDTNAWHEEDEDVNIKNNKLLQLKIHLCTGCKYTLRKPIMLDPKTGSNYCFQCKIGKNFVRNEALEDILNKLSIPCVYAINGCIQKLNYSVLGAHEALCSERTTHCPLKWSAECIWEGLISEILDHCYDEHEENVIELSGNLTLDVERGLKDVVVIKESNIFVVRLEHDEKTLCKVYLVGNIEKSEDFSFVVNDCDKQQVIPFITFSQDITAPCIIENAERTGITIKIFSSNIAVDETLVSLLECPVCNQIMRPPIFLCATGHSFCHTCKPQLSSCSICRGVLGNARNYTVEALCSRILIPCFNQQKGCTKVLWANEMNQHEDECNLRNYFCPFKESKCSFEGVLTTLYKHLSRSHIDKIHRSGQLYSSPYCATSITENYYLLAFGKVFRLRYRPKGSNCDCQWSVEFIGPKKDAKKFEYQIELVDESDKSKTFGKTSTCHGMIDTVIDGGDCIRIPAQIVSWFVKDEKIAYCCQIRKLPA